MRTTLILNDQLLKCAQELSNIEEKTALVHAGLEALIVKYSSERLAKLGGTEKQAKPIPRRKTHDR